MVLTDARRRDNPIIAVNPAFSELTGYHEPEVMGRNCRLLAGEATEPWASAVLHDAVKHGRAGFAELLNYRKDGKAFLNAVMIAPSYDDDGELSFFVGSQMDVSAEGALVGRRRRAGDRLRRLTPRQTQVLHLMIGGLRNKQIADRLKIDEKTVKMHRAGLLANLQASSTPHAVRIAVEGGMLG